MRIIDGGTAEVVKDPSELTEDEAEARQTGVPVEEVVAKKKTKKAAKAEKPTKKAAEPKKSPKAKKTAKKGAAATSKSAKAARGAGKKSAYVRKGEKNGKPSNRGPKGNKTPKRSAKDGGVFGRKADRARKEKGWTQLQLAEKIGITQPAVCNILKGTAGASEATQKRISKALGLK